MEIICPACKAVIPQNNVNVATDLAQCSTCSSLHKLSDLIKNKPAQELTSPPRGSKLQLKSRGGDSVEILLPPKGFRAEHIFLAFFSIFWLGFISVWTTMAAFGSIFFALFSIPFWFVGFGLIYGLINSITEKQIISLNRKELVLNKIRKIGSKTKRFSLSEIDKVDMRLQTFNLTNLSASFQNMSKLNQHSKAGTMLPTVISGLKHHTFFESAHSEEQYWVIEFLNAFLSKIK